MTTKPADPRIEMLHISVLTPYAANARTHSDAQIKQIEASILEFGFTNPVLVDSGGGIIAGHGRVMAAKNLGLDMIPTVRLSHLSEAQKRAYILADNKLAMNAGWDDAILSLELAGLDEIDFDLSLIGFSEEELSLLLDVGGEELTEGNGDPDSVPEVPVVPVSRLGDVWLLGDVKYVCDDCKTEYSPIDAQKMGMECNCG